MVQFYDNSDGANELLTANQQDNFLQIINLSKFNL